MHNHINYITGVAVHRLLPLGEGGQRPDEGITVRGVRTGSATASPATPSSGA